MQGAQVQPGTDVFLASGHKSLTVETAGQVLYN